MQIKDNTNAMIIVGDSKSDFFKNLKQKYQNDILFIGLVPPKRVGDYFKTLDIGLIPFVLNDFTNNAYPIKALEYGLAGGMVISTPLDVLVSKRLPFIEFCNIEDFAKKMKNIKKSSTKFDFSDLSWQKQTSRLISFIEESI